MRRLAMLAALGWGFAAAPAMAFPVDVDSCGETVTFDRPPERVVVNDTNMVQTLLDLGLADRIVGVAGIGGVEHFIEAEPGVVAGLNQFSEHYPTLEAIIGQDPDFVFMGWFYGFNAAQAITPEALAGFGIKSYVMRESCIRVMRREPMSMEVLYADIEALGTIFGIEDRAQALIHDYRRRIADVQQRIAGATERPRVLYCGNCTSDDPPLVIGAEGMPRLIAEIAGGQNIFNDIEDSYVRVSWEEVVQRNPQWILVSNHRISDQAAIDYLKASPILRDIDAVRHDRFFSVTYPQRSPSTRNVETIERFARAMHPDLFED